MAEEIHITFVAESWAVSWHSGRKISEHPTFKEAIEAAKIKVKTRPWGEVTYIKKIDGKLIQTLWSYAQDGFPPMEIGQHEFSD